MFLVSFQGVYGLGHIVYLIISILLMVLGIIIIKLVKKEDIYFRIIKISGIILLILILINRISVTYYDVVISKREGYSWLNIIPNTFCGLSSLILSLAIIFGKKDNVVLHFISYLGIIGGIITMFYPDFLESQNFFDLRSVSGLLHHTIMVWLVIICMLTKYIVPTMKKWSIFPIGLSMVMTFGLFEKDCLHFTKAMQIGEPLLKSAPIFTSWYVIGILILILHFLYLFIYDLKVNKVGLKEIFTLS